MRAFLNDFGLFLLRIAFGGTMAAHGLQSMFVRGAESGIAFYSKVNIPNPDVMFWVGNLTETLGGIAIVLGLLARLAGLGIALVMGGAIYYVHLNNGFFASNKGYEYALILGVIGLAILLCGPGRWSIDHFLFGRRSKDSGVDTVMVQPSPVEPAVVSPMTTPSPMTTTTTNPQGPSGSVTL